MQLIRFPTRGGFHETVKQRVEQYFADSRRSTTGDWRLFVKTGVILAWLAGSYALLARLYPFPQGLKPWEYKPLSVSDLHF